MKTNERIKDLRETKKLTQRNVANAIHLNTSVYQKIEMGTRPIREKELVKIADFFNVSSDYLLGRTKNPEFPEENSSSTGENISAHFRRNTNDLKPKDIEILEQEVIDFQEFIIKKTKERKNNIEKRPANKHPTNPLGQIIQFPNEKNDHQNNQEEIEETISYGAVSAGTGEYIFGLERAEPIWLPKRKIPEEPFDYVLKINGDSMEPTFKHGEYIFIQSYINGGEIRDGMLAIVLYNSEVYFKKLYIEQDKVRLISLNKAYPDIVVTDPTTLSVLGKIVI